MTRIESDSATINKSPKEIFQFLSNFNNFKQLMPEQVVDWVSTDNDCSFTIKGMASLGMEFAEKTDDTQIKIIRKGKAPFDFILYCNISPVENNNAASNLQLAFDADLNPFLKMMAEKPLRNFLNILVTNFGKINS